jgi:hypothetical protein
MTILLNAVILAPYAREGGLDFSLEAGDQFTVGGDQGLFGFDFGDYGFLGFDGREGDCDPSHDLTIEVVDHTTRRSLLELSEDEC